MLIGSNFDKRAMRLLMHAMKKCEGEAGCVLSVKEIIEELKFDKTEAKSVLQYLDSMACIRVETIGGPYLFGDISITKKGVATVQRKLKHGPE